MGKAATEDCTRRGRRVQRPMQGRQERSRSPKIVQGFADSSVKRHETLSHGELQRVSIARALYRRPRIVLLDEATSNIGFDLEMSLYERLQQENISFVSVGHRLSLNRYHDYELHLAGRSVWTYREIDQSLLSSCVPSIRGRNSVLPM